MPDAQPVEQPKEPEADSQGQKVKIARRTYPKFRWYDQETNLFHYSQDTLFAKKAEGIQILAPYCIVVEKERQLNTEDLRMISEFSGVLDSTPTQIPIYSGDLVRIPNNQVFDDERSMVVQWVPHFARWNISPFLVGGKQIFVTGNIYQPEFEKLVQKEVHGFEVATSFKPNGQGKGKLVN